ncbi:hypothetical protein ONZ45_g6177 [Pleurotus djamor]|nr:hypothetical protein ONZ45_g19079 [Pleurotus djamor]KAJ8516559.1 hypothetical protein ONZ45_g6177 [Pleurotus djamor]
MGGRAKHQKLAGIAQFATELQGDVKSEPPTKKRKIAPAGWIQKYDASHLVPYATEASQIPEELRKYFFQRKRYFSKYNFPPGCLLDTEGWYSVTPERIADQIAERCRCDTILDPFCGVGANAIAFAKTCQRVIALDINPTRLALARHNAQIYGVADRIEFILADFVSFAKTLASTGPTTKRKIDVVFLSPPWGGPSYQQSPSKHSLKDEPETESDTYSLASVKPIHGAELFALTQRITHNIAYYLPRNMNLDEIGKLSAEDGVLVEVEEEWMGDKLKALTCYFGGLVQGQEKLY